VAAFESNAEAIKGIAMALHTKAIRWLSGDLPADILNGIVFVAKPSGQHGALGDVAVPVL
jgi:hypothetical protein